MSGEFVISSVRNAKDTATRDIGVSSVLEAIRTGGKKLRGQIEQIRNQFEAELAFTQGNLSKAKLAVDPLKKALPAVTWPGRFSYRASDHLVAPSGLLCADLDSLGQKELKSVREKLTTSPHLFVLFLSPTGHGLKAVFRVPADASKHAGSFRAVEAHVKELTGVQIDESCKDLARLCFMSYDAQLYYNPDAIELEPLPEPEKPKPAFNSAGEVNLSERQRIAAEVLGNIDWQSETSGFVQCPGAHLHTAGDGERDCEIHLDGVPTVFCVHKSCRGIIAGVNHELRSRIGKAEYQVEDEKEPPGPPKKSAATQLVQLAEAFEFFHDRQDRPYVRLEVDGHREVWPVESSKFRKLLARMFHKHTGRAINRNAIGDAVTTLAGKACFDGNEEPVFLRVAWHCEHILIDLCDEGWRVVEVTATGWRILDQAPIAFIRTGSMQSLPVPVQGVGKIDPLWELLNVTEKQRPLVAGALLNAFHPNGPYFVVNYIGEQGTAKSCAARIHRQLIDPNENPLRSPPKEEQDLLVQASNNRCVTIDNLSSLPLWLSDAICRVATGGGHSARTLYTDLEETSIKVKRPVILNGIEDVAKRPDLAERGLQIELETIDGTDRLRILEEDLWPEFEKQRAVIFSGILDGLVRVLRDRPAVKGKLKWLPRMADATLWATAGETAFGWEHRTFLQAYRLNLDEVAVASLEAHPVGVAIVQLLEAQSQWEGTATQLLKALNGSLSEEERRAKEKDQDWPRNARSLGHALRRLAQALRRSGIKYQRPPRRGQRILTMCKVADKTPKTSITSITEGKIVSTTSSENVGILPDIVGETSSLPQCTDVSDDSVVLSSSLHFSPPGPPNHVETPERPENEAPPAPDAQPQPGAQIPSKKLDTLRRF